MDNDDLGLSKQKHNPKAEQSLDLGKHISTLYRYGRSYMDQQMNAYEVGSGQYSFLFYLYNHDGASQDAISKALAMDKTTTTRAIQKLEESGLVKRLVDANDRRINHVYLTPAGYSLQKELINFSQDWEALLLANFDENEKIQLENAILKLAKNAMNYRNNICKKVQ
ncbi:MAG: MarR family winged helix-turn-helix transcriptional regulator [Clostridia bacterium]